MRASSVFLHMTLHVAMETASFLLEVFVKAPLCLPFLCDGCIDFHKDRVLLLLSKEPMGISLPFGQLREGLAMLWESFFHNTIMMNLPSSRFFSTIYSGGPSIPIKDPLEDTIFESIFELFYGTYSGLQNCCNVWPFSTKLNVVLNRVGIALSVGWVE